MIRSSLNLPWPSRQLSVELTENLINQFRLISPEIFGQVDAIKDGKGRITDVYIKFIPQNEATVNAAGITCVAQSELYNDLCVSEYGEIYFS